MTTPEINIHEYPENATPRQLADYRHAVELAVLEGGALEYFDQHYHDWLPIKTNRVPLNWPYLRFRIARDPLDELAPGHNPAKLTCRQVGTHEGWRLLEPGELDPFRPLLKEIECWRGERWSCRAWSGGLASETYRTRKPPLYFLPEPSPVKKDDPHAVIMRLRYALDGGLEYDSISLDGGRTWQPLRQEVVS